MEETEDESNNIDAASKTAETDDPLKNYYTNLCKKLNEREAEMATLIHRNKLVKTRHQQLQRIFARVQQCHQENIEIFTKELDNSRIALKMTQILMPDLNATEAESSDKSEIECEPGPSSSVTKPQMVTEPQAVSSVNTNNSRKLPIRPLNMRQVEEELINSFRNELLVEQADSNRRSSGCLSTILEESTRDISSQQMKQLCVKLQRLSDTIVKNKLTFNEDKSSKHINSSPEAHFMGNLVSSTPIDTKIETMRRLGLIPCTEVNASPKASTQAFITRRRKILDDLEKKPTKPSNLSPIKSILNSSGSGSSSNKSVRFNIEESPSETKKIKRKNQSKSLENEGSTNKKKRLSNELKGLIKAQHGAKTTVTRPARRAKPLKNLKEPTLRMKMRQ